MGVMIRSLILPPIGLLFGVLLGLLLALRWRRLGWSVATLSAACLLILAMPITGGWLMFLLEANLPLTAPPTAPPEAVVILSAEARPVDAAGTRFEPGPLTWERLITGARLARRARLPILVTGGVMQRRAPSLAEVMAQALSEHFTINARWQEQRSRDTWENAAFSAEMLRDGGIHDIYLVSHAWHLRRAIAAFAHFGIHATAVPVRMHARPAAGLDDFVPSISGWIDSSHALHEWIGIAYYALR